MRSLRIATCACGLLLALASLDCAEATAVDVQVFSDVPCAINARAVLVGAEATGELDGRAVSASSTVCAAGTPNSLGHVVVTPASRRDGGLALAVMQRTDGGPADDCNGPSRPPGCIVARRQLRFLPRTTLNMRVDLRKSCEGITCSADKTCILGGECVSAAVDVARCSNGPCDETALGKAYTTDFPLTENPLSENGAWTNGRAVGLDWYDVATVPGRAFAPTVGNGFDCIAHLSGFGANQYAEGKVRVEPGYAPTDTSDVMLLLRFKITPRVARGYEITIRVGGGGVVARWNGAFQDYVVLTPSGPGFGPIRDGDVVRATMVGNTIVGYQNGAEVLRVVDSTWVDGGPGLGMSARPGGGVIPLNYVFTRYTAGEL